MVCPLIMQLIKNLQAYKHAIPRAPYITAKYTFMVTSPLYTVAH